MAFGAGDSKYSDVEEFMDKDMLLKNKFCMDMLSGAIWKPLYLEEYKNMGDKYDFEDAMYSKSDKSMEDFKKMWFEGMVLSKGKYYTFMNRSYREQTEGLSKMLYYAKDWEAFKRIAIWARKNVNEGMFATAFTIAAMRREDMKFVTLPPLYEIVPQLFFNQKLIAKAEDFDMDKWELEEGKKLKDMSKELKEAFMKKWGWWNAEKNRWELIWNEVEDNKILRKEFEEDKNDKQNMDLMKDMKMFWIKADYSDDLDNKNEESKLAYFTEDSDWNMYWYYLNMKYASFAKEDEFGFEKERRGEWWMFNIQQMLARYNQERLSQGMGKIDELTWYKPIAMGYNPRLKLKNGLEFSERPNNWEIYSEETSEMVRHLKDWGRRMRDTFDSGIYTTSDGDKIDMTKPEAMEEASNMLQGNMDSIDRKFFGAWMMFAQFAASGNKFESYKSGSKYIQPNAMLHYETMLRDPLSYMIFEKINKYFNKFSYHLGPYQKDELFLEGVKIKDISFDNDMKTFFSWTDSDMSAFLDSKYLYKDGKLDWNTMLLARRERLDHKPFEMKFEIDSDKICECVIRLFLGPKYDEYGREMDMNKFRQNSVLLNQFYASLKSGKTEIKIKSEDFNFTRADYKTSAEMYKEVKSALEGKTKILLEKPKSMLGAYPDRLMIPKGWVDGMPMQIFAIASKYEPIKEIEGKKSYDQNFDKRSYRFPLDRQIEEFDFWMPNMFMKDVKIYHDKEVKDFKRFE